MSQIDNIFSLFLFSLPYLVLMYINIRLLRRVSIPFEWKLGVFISMIAYLIYVIVQIGRFEILSGLLNVLWIIMGSIGLETLILVNLAKENLSKRNYRIIVIFALIGLLLTLPFFFFHTFLTVCWDSTSGC